MKQLTSRIINLFSTNKKIFLKRGGPYFYIGEAPTKINGKDLQDALEYRISEKNKKRVTLKLIESIYNFYSQNGRMQKRFEINAAFRVELKSRPCNYSVAKFIVEQLIKEDQLNR